MNSLPEEDQIVLDRFVRGIPGYLMGRSLLVTQEQTTLALWERATKTRLAKIDYSGSIPFLILRENITGYEFLPQYFEEHQFIRCKQSNPGTIEFKLYHHEGYRIRENSISELWKIFRKDLSLYNNAKIVFENEWCQVRSIVCENLTYTVKFNGMAKDYIIGMPNAVIIWAEPEVEIPDGIDSYFWGDQSILSSNRVIDITPDLKTDHSSEIDQRTDSIPVVWDFGEILDVHNLPTTTLTLNNSTAQARYSTPSAKDLDCFEEIERINSYIQDLYSFLTEEIGNRNLAQQEMVQRFENVEKLLNKYQADIERIKALVLNLEQSNSLLPTILNLTEESRNLYDSSGSTSLLIPLE